MAKSMGVRGHIKRSGEKFAYALHLSSGSRGVAYCLSNEALARAYAARGGRWGEGGKRDRGAVGRGATCTDAKKAALTALRSGRLVSSPKKAPASKAKKVAACIAACKRR